MVAATYPPARQRPVSYAGEAGAITPLGWCLHVTVMNGSPWATFQSAVRPNRRFSHLWVSKGGTVEQYGRLDRASWAQGGGNGAYWSVETEGFPNEPLTDAQLDALAAWHVWSGTSDDLADHPGARGITCHYVGGADWGGHTCPDPTPGAGPRSRQRAEIIRRAQTLRGNGTGGNDMDLAELANWDVSALVGLPPKSLNFQTLIGRLYTGSNQIQSALAHGAPVTLPPDVVSGLAGQIAQAIVAGMGPSLAKGVADELARRLAN